MKKFHDTNFKLHLLLSKVISMGDSLSIRNISKSYNHNNIFNLISFDIGSGQILNLSGANGSGKTTLMKIVSSQILEYTGEVFLGDENIKNLGDEYFTKVIYLPPVPSLYENLSLIENIHFFTSLIGIRHNDKAERLINDFKLTSHTSKKISQLSDGSKKKVSILVMFLMNPDFFILDEPYTYLDADALRTLNILINKSTEEGKSFLITDNSIGLKDINFSGLVEL